MNPFNLEQDFNAEQEEQELNFDTIFEDFLNETDTANDDVDFIIEQGQEDTITHIIQLDLFQELNNLNGFNINFDNNFDFYRNNDYWGDRPLTPEEDRLAGLHINFPRRIYDEDEDEEDEPLEQDAEPALLFCTIDYDNITDIHANVNEDDDIEEQDETQEQDDTEEQEQDDLLQYILDNDEEEQDNNDNWEDRPLTPEEDRLAGLHINFPRRNYNEDEDDDLLQYILDNDDVITYDCPMEADAFYAD
jgi:hypothetical protein